ncbi:MAG: hypothetical protein M3R47_18535 [Chloroflexota bacterium]|nr:hypothetical protein [Chloroflexota bacterium]
MATKQKSTTKAPAKVKKDPFEEKPTVSFARDGHNLASLLWQKILASVTPEVQRMLFVHNDLAYIWDQMAPSDFDRVGHPDLTHGELLENIHKAEYLLTGFTNKTMPYVDESEDKWWI